MLNCYDLHDTDVPASELSIHSFTRHETTCPTTPHSCSPSIPLFAINNTSENTSSLSQAKATFWESQVTLTLTVWLLSLDLVTINDFSITSSCKGAFMFRWLSWSYLRESNILISVSIRHDKRIYIKTLGFHIKTPHTFVCCVLIARPEQYKPIIIIQMSNAYMGIHNNKITKLQHRHR